MTLLEAFKKFSIKNLDDEEYLVDIVYDNQTNNYEYDMFIHNLKEICYDEEDYKKLCNLEMTPEFMNKLKENDTDEIWEDHINQTILDAAWLTYNGYDYEECKANDDFDDLYEDCHNYEFCFGDFDLTYEFECDVDLT